MDLPLAKPLDHLQADPSRLAAVDFDRAGDQHLADPAAARGHDDWVVLGAERDDRLIGLDDAAQRLALGVDHGPAAWRTTSRRCGTSQDRAGSAAAAPKCRWGASPSKTRPRPRPS